MESNFGIKLGELRKKFEMTQEELASRIGVTSQAVSKWETHASLPDCALLPEIANVFNVSIDYLFDYTSGSFEEAGRVSEAILDGSNENEIYQKAFRLNWELQKSLGRVLSKDHKSIMPGPGIPEMPGRSTSIIRKSGYSRSVSTNEVSLFTLVALHEQKVNWLEERLNKYGEIFAWLSNENTLKVLEFLYSRKQPDIGFTAGAVSKACGAEEADIEIVLDSFSRYNILMKRELMIDEYKIPVYTYTSDGIILTMLILCDEMLYGNYSFHLGMSGYTDPIF